MTLRDRAAGDPVLSKKAAFFEDFWRGEGPCPVIFARPHLALGKNYERCNLLMQHEDSRKLLDEALAQALAAIEEPGDGIPVMRSDLGTTLFPSALGLSLSISEEQQPSLAEHWSIEDYSRLAGMTETFAQRGEIPMADRMYRLLRDGQEAGRIPSAIQAYLPDNQGVFDLTHIVVGSDVFYAFTDSPETVHAAQERSLALFLAGSRHFKDLIDEDATSMVHGHGMRSGAWFPDTGIRISEDSCTLISSEAIRTFCLPYIERAIAPFGRGFLHFCGRHEDFLKMACESSLISTINLGNPELYDLAEVFDLCGRTHTVFFGHIAKGPGEGDEAYAERLADLAGSSACKLILVAPEVDDKAALADRWQRLTRRGAL